MPRRAEVRSFQSVEAFRLALIKYRDAAAAALESAAGEARRTLSWLEGEQTVYWRHAVRDAEQEVTRTQEAYRQKALYKDATGQRQSAVDERVAMEKAKRRLEQCRAAAEATKRHKILLRREVDNFHGRANVMTNLLAADVPAAVAALADAVATLEQYAATRPDVAPAAGRDDAPPPSMAQPAAEDAAPPDPAAAVTDARTLRDRTPGEPARRRAARTGVIPPLPDAPPAARAAAESHYGPKPGRYDLVTLAVAGESVYLDRCADPADNDSGWHAGDASPAPADADLACVPYARLAAAAPHLAELLALPTGTLIVADRGTVTRITDPLGRVLYEDA